MSVLKWKKIPTGWINETSLGELKWARGEGSTNSAALMVYICLGTYASVNDDPVAGVMAGQAKPTYQEIKNFCGISRDLINRGLRKLEDMGLIEVKRNGVGVIYTILGLGNANKRWGKIPHAYFSRKGEMRNVFGGLNVRSKETLHALKIYLMAIKYRDSVNNYARFSYDKIESFAGIHRPHIKPALCLLTENKLLMIDMVKAKESRYRHNLYRIIGVSGTTHLATLPDEHFDELFDELF